MVQGEQSLLRMPFALCLTAALMLLDAQGPLSAAELWPPQPPQSSTQHYWQPGYPPYRANKRLRVPPYGALFFKDRQTLDKYNDHIELRQQMRRDDEVVYLPKGRKVTALEHIRILRGRVHDDQYGDGYLIIFDHPLF
jgi:hypothetical protein